MYIQRVLRNCLKCIRIPHEQLYTSLRAELGLNTNTVQPPGTDLVGHPGQVHGHQRHGNIGPDRFAAQTSHTRVQVLEQSRVNVFRADRDVPGHQVDSG